MRPSDDDVNRAIALAMIDARLEAAGNGDPEGAQEEIDLLAELADSDDAGAIIEESLDEEKP